MAVPAAFIQPNQKARTTGYQNNCGVNALVHILVPKMGEVPAGAPGRQELLTAFNEVYGVYIRNWDELTHILQGIQNPVHREVVLGLVLRKLTTDPTLQVKQPDPVGWKLLGADHVLGIANKFGIKVEGYSTHEATKQALREQFAPGLRTRLGSRSTRSTRFTPKQLEIELEKEVTTAFNAILTDQNHPSHPDRDQFRIGVGAPAVPQPVPSIATLKLWNVGNHWEYEETNAATTTSHNIAYQGDSSSHYEADDKTLRKNISDAVLKTPAGQHPDLNAVFHRFESNKHSKQGPAGMFDAIQKVVGMLPTIMNPLGIGGKNNFFVFLGQLFSQIISAFLPLISIFQDMAKTFRQANKTEDAPLDDDDIQQDPKIAKEARQFARLSNELASAGEDEKEIAAHLNKEWRKNPNAPQVWNKLITSMVDNGLLGEADKWLRGQEKKLISELTTIEEELANEVPIVAPIGAPAVARAPDRTAIRTMLNTYRDGLTRFEDPILMNADEEYQKRNFKVRFEMFQACSTDMCKVRDKHKEELSTVQHIREVTQLQNNINQNILAVQTAGNTVTVVERSLQQRLLDVQGEFATLTTKLNDSRGNAIVENNLTGSVHGRVQNLALTHQADYRAAAVRAAAGAGVLPGAAPVPATGGTTVNRVTGTLRGG